MVRAVQWRLTRGLEADPRNPSCGHPSGASRQRLLSCFVWPALFHKAGTVCTHRALQVAKKHVDQNFVVHLLDLFDSGAGRTVKSA